MSWEALIPVALAVVALGKSFLDNYKLKNRLQSVEDAIKSDDNNYYIICPSCGTKVILSKVKLYLEVKDND